MGKHVIGKLHHHDTYLGGPNLAESQLFRHARSGAPSLSRMGRVGDLGVVVGNNHIISSE
jgi:hypothetical protein